ncbi:hypothetical protein AWC11_07530 [Mycobacterium interjectum]|nr:hypothetical protein AWC11_07530 [Mycobacterium interjectum]
MATGIYLPFARGPSAIMVTIPGGLLLVMIVEGPRWHFDDELKDPSPLSWQTVPTREGDSRDFTR